MKFIKFYGCAIFAITLAALAPTALADGDQSARDGHSEKTQDAAHGHATGMGHEDDGHHATDDGHHAADDGHHDMMQAGRPGRPAEVERTVKVIMTETEDGDMLFSPDRMIVEQDETIRLAIANMGEQEHEFVLDDHDGIMEHKSAMEESPHMQHNDPNSIRLDSGESGDIIWTFANAGEFEFACLIPGHYEAGMRGTLVVKAN